MKLMKYKNQLITLLHLFFWMFSISAWNIVFNPGVTSTAAIKGLQDYWAELMLLDIFILFFCTMPFIWCFKRVKKWLKIAVTVLFLVACYLLFGYLQPEKNREYLSLFADLFYVLVFHLSIAAAVYYNLQVLIRKYLKESKFGIYLLAVSGLVVLAALVNYALFDDVIDRLFPSLYFISYYKVWELMVIIGAYLVFTTVLYLIWQYTSMLIANRDKARNELSALKAQINPHFLFNNLNTIYSMASKNDRRTAEVVLKLSDFLRYVLYDTSSETIPLEKEVEIIRTYVSLQKERVHHEITRIELTTEGQFKGVEIAPLLLLPLAENCFKHGKGKNEGTIQIYMGFDGRQLIFRTENNIAKREKTIAKENGGIGINNVENRLQLIYPGQHSLEYGEKGGVFTLEMKIELNQKAK